MSEVSAVTDPAVYRCSECGQVATADTDVGCVDCGVEMEYLRPGTVDDSILLYVGSFIIPRKVEKWLQRSLVLSTVLIALLMVLSLVIVDAFHSRSAAFGWVLGLFSGGFIAEFGLVIQRRRIRSKFEQEGLINE